MGSSNEAREINSNLGLIKNKIYTIQQHFERDDEDVNACNLRDAYLGKDRVEKTDLV
ncbi:MAG: hypothetical protein ACJART_000742 [Maribacter sp.]|jgi:hypothetical protein